MSEHGSPWLANPSPPSWPNLQGTLEVDFVVVGAGISGLTTASLLHGRGSSVAVVEANRVGHGTTGHTTGKITSQHGLVYRSLIERHGEERARAYAQVNQQAIGEIEATVRRLGVDCSFERLPAFIYTRDPRRREDLESEYSAVESLGLPASLTTDIDLPFPIELALRFDDQALFDTGPYVLALAQEISSGSGLIFENTRAVGISETTDGVTVHTESGEVKARNAIVATLIPFMDRSGFFARMKPSRAYGVAATLNEGGITGMHINVDSPTRSTRPWRQESGAGIVVVGEGHSVGHRRARPRRWGDLESWARQHFDVESFEYRWSSQDFESVDQLPYVGRAPFMRRTYVATGFRKWGLTNATAAAHMIADLLTGRDGDWVAAYDATRLGGINTLARTSLLNLGVANKFVQGRVRRLLAPSVDDLNRGEGGLVRENGTTLAAYRDPDGDLHCVSPTCTHLGCTVRWNHAEKSWDCPCHGSRFSVDGEILNGPATDPLQPIVVEPGDG
ncbi:MAG TPA: FAD-dependent oxidoreductase [Acidimicrobiia bacterium]|nr:FAD-dependent oxidoreductase [Acidimicrobiia bacterium]